MTGLIGVAISTTGDEHRMKFLETCAMAWRQTLPSDSVIVVTVDGDEAAVERVRYTLSPVAHRLRGIYRVGQPHHLDEHRVRDGRLGVAVNKNTGLELLMDATVEHAFLCDDDTWPLDYRSVQTHIDFGQPHSMVCWGAHRQPEVHRDEETYATWTWPRGALLYVQPQVLAVVGGMIEEFGPGGHEHVEWSRRIHQAGFTPAPYLSPALYAASRGNGARGLWHAEDMIRPGEPLGNARLRRKRLTSVRRRPGDWDHIEKIMAARDGDTSYVPFRAHENGRTSATLYTI